MHQALLAILDEANRRSKVGLHCFSRGRARTLLRESALARMASESHGTRTRPRVRGAAELDQE